MRTPRRATRALVVPLLLFVLVYAFREPICVALGRFVVADEPLEKSDALVVLSGSVPDRMLEAVDLYLEGYAPRIVLIEERSRPGLNILKARGASIPHKHELNISIAEQLNVPRRAIVLLNGPANSTVSEAEVVLAYLVESGARSALIVTSKMHSYRSGLIYRSQAPPGMRITARGSRHDPFSPQTWWQSRGQIRRLFFEYQKLAVFWLRDRWLGADDLR